MRTKMVIVLTLAIVSMYFSIPKIYAASYHEKIEDGWLFYHEQFVPDTDSLDLSSDAQAVQLPIEFDDLSLDNETYGTFITTVKIPEDRRNTQIGIELPFVYSAATIFIDGEKVKEVGKTGTNSDEHEINLQSVIIPFTPTSSIVEIAIQVSSFDHIRGGFSSAPTIGDWETITHEYSVERYETVFVGTIILIVGLATLTIGLMSRHEKLFFVFGLFSIVISIREAVVVPFIYHELPFSMSYLLATKIEYITTPIAFALYALYIYLLYSKLFPKWILYFNAIVLLFIAVIPIFTEPNFFQTVFFSVFPLAILFVLYNIWIVFKAARLKLEQAKSMLLGIFFVFTGLVIDFLSGMGVINLPPLAGVMIMLNVLLILFSLCLNYVKQVKELRNVNKKLDELVINRTSQLNDANEELKKLVNMDALTGIYNRHKFDETISVNFEAATKKNKYLGLIMMDLDEFKKYNDSYGHVAGDNLLTRFAQLIKSILPKDVTFVRYGGEEFAVILPGYSLQETKEIAEEIRQTTENERIEHIGRNNGVVTVSLGCAERKIDEIKDERELIKVSDERLYLSKAKGSNRVTAG